MLTPDTLETTCFVTGSMVVACGMLSTNAAVTAETYILTTMATRCRVAGLDVGSLLLI